MTKTKLIALMKRRARAFEKLAPSAKRVAIAKDVIAQLDMNRFKPTRNVYVDMKSKMVRSGGQRVCELTAGVPCRVCALGAMFIAGVERAGGMSVDELGHASGDLFRGDDGDGSYSYLYRFFEHDQLQRIERYFEGWGQVTRDTADDVMRRIMANIVKNRGRFTLELS